MVKRLRILAIAMILFVITQSTIFTVTVAKNIFLDNSETEMIIVDKNGKGDYEKIQEAIDRAESGSIIFIRNGEYNEIIDINKKVTLIGEERESTLINPISEKNKYAIGLGASEIKIQSLSIKNNAPGLYSTAVRVTSPKIMIYDCNIYDTPIGLAIWTSYNYIYNCNFWNCNDEAIALIGSTYSECDHNKIMNCKFYQNCDGIELQQSSNNNIIDCKFYESSHESISEISESENNIISNCEISDNYDKNALFKEKSNNNQFFSKAESNFNTLKMSKIE